MSLRFHKHAFIARPWDVFIAVLVLLSGIRYLHQPLLRQVAPVGQFLGDWIFLWASGYVVAGLLMTAGMGFLRPRWEAVGMAMLMVGAAIQIDAAVHIPGPFGVFGIHDVLLYAAFYLAAIVRLWTIAQRRETIVVEVPDE